MVLIDRAVPGKFYVSISYWQLMFKTSSFIGATYGSKIGLDEDTADLEDVIITPLKPSPESSSIMYFDLETTGFSKFLFVEFGLN